MQTTLRALGCGLALVGGIGVSAGAVAQDTSTSMTGQLLYSQLTEGQWQIWRHDLATGARTQLTLTPSDKHNPAWGPDGRVTYQTANQGCESVGPHGGEEPMLAALWPIKDLVWSPDGARVIFSRFRTDLNDSANLWVSDPSGRAPVMLTHAVGIQYNPSWSPDGTQLVYSGGHGYGTYELYVINADGTQPRQLTHNTTHEFWPAWSPDGQWIAYSADATGDYEIWVMHPDGTGATQLTHSPGLDSRPAWSPDSQHIAFTTNRAGHLEIWVMRADGLDPRVLESAAGGACDPAWR